MNMGSLGSTITEADLGSVPFSNDTPTKFLYVQAGATGGDGSHDHPFGTIQAAVNIATPGTAVMVEAGTYVENVKFPSQAGGTPDAPIWLVSADGVGAAKVIPADSTVSTIKGLGVHNIVVEGFAVQGGLNGIQFSQSGLDLQHTVANIVVQGNIIYDTLQDAIKISQADNVWVLNNTVHNAGDQATDFVSTTNSVIAYNAAYDDTGPAVIFAKGGSGNVLIAHNLIDGAVADGLEIGGWAVGSNYQPVYTTYEADHVTAEDNVVLNVAKRPLNILGATNSDIHNNFFEANPSYMTAINVGPGFDPLRVSANVDIHDNTISHAGTTQIQVQAGSNNAIDYHDNVLSDTNTVQAGTIAFNYWNGGLAVAAGAGSGVVLAPLPPPVVPDGTLVLTGTKASEILIGQGSSNQIYGGLGNDKLYGGSGDDTLDGGNGVDTMYGGTGNDTYVVDGPNDVIVEQPNGGIDTVMSGMSGFHIDGYANVENAVYTGSNAVNILGNDLDNVLVGGSLADTLDGGAGADTLEGGDGNDIYMVHDGRTQILENPNCGIDTVRSDVSYVLPANVENMLLTNAGLTGVGNELDNQITGSAGGDSLYGGAGADTLTAGSGNDVLDGGSGADSMLGGLGDDTYFIDDPHDVVVENLNAGHDLIVTTLSTYQLVANVEDLTGVRDDGQNLTGNVLNNVITGGDGPDTFHGGGGIDTFIGGMGDDVYYVDDVRTQVIEAPGGGYDTVYLSNGGWAPGAGQEIEKIVATGTTGIALTGNEFNNLLVGNSGANLIDGKGGVDTMQGGDGADTYIVDNSADVVVENPNQGNDTVKASVDYTLSANIETLIMTAPGHTGVGSADANTILGSTGADTLDGGAGNDTLTGGGGNDTFVFTPGSGSDVITDFAGGDQLDLSAYLAAGAHPTVVWSTPGAVIQLDANDSILLKGVAVAAVTATANGFTLNAAVASAPPVVVPASAGLNLHGTPGNDSLVGDVGPDTLDGGAGVDTLVGGAGDDLYFVHDARTLVVEAPGGGTDTVKSDVSLTLAPNVENLLLTQNGLTGTGNELANKITAGGLNEAMYGGAGDDTLLGGDGADTLDGGTGGDSLLGGKGDDTYVVDDARDTVIENAGAGTDTVQTTLPSYVLAANVENLTNIGAAGADLTGNGLANVITGSAGADTIHGGGGIDTFIGGAGDDTYYVDDIRATVVEQAGGGYDTVYVSNSGWIAGPGQSIEKIVAVAGTQGISLTGNEQANLLVGNAGANVINGGGGVDTMVGGAGDDTYLVDNSGDVIVENAGEGNDQVKASVDYVLSANVETLTLTTPGHVGVGNAQANLIVGTTGSDTLEGGGGADTLTGGGGADVFLFKHLSDGGATITDFQVGLDKLNVEGLLADLGGGATLSYGHVAAGLQVFVDHGGAHDLIAQLNGVMSSSLSADSFDWKAMPNMSAAGGSNPADAVAAADAGGSATTSDGAATAGGSTSGSTPAASAGTANNGGETSATPTLSLVAGTASADELRGTAASESLAGGAGDDILHASGGHDVLDGGAGTDTAVFAGFAHDYTISTVNGATVISGGPEGGVTTLANIEDVQFLDGTLTFDAQGDAAKILRLYDGFLGRAPDAAGLEGYLKYIANGHTLADMAANAYASPEFQSHTASLNDTQYVEYVYETALHRQADPGGLATYVADLENGTFTRASLILQAAESPEHTALLSGAIAQGVWEPNQTVEAIELLYDGAVQRQPDASGLAGYGALVASGTTFKEIANQMASSAEFLSVHGSQTDAQYVDSLYVATVGRHADAFGLAAYTDELAHGYSRGDVLFQMAMSQEHQSHVLSTFDPLLLNLS